MEHAMVSVATGVLSPLIGKLSTLLTKEYAKFKGVRKEMIISLKEELSSMDAMLEKLAAEDDPDVQLKEWGNQIRDLSYDIEDCIDDFMLRVEHGQVKPDEGFFQKLVSKVKALRAHHDIADKIRELKARVDDVSKRRNRYYFEGATTSSSTVAGPIDPRLHALYAERESLVGIDQPRDEIIKLLIEGQGESVKKLKVFSIVGSGGLGKTTLADEVRRKLGEQFDCRVFVSVSQSPDVIRLLSKIISHVNGQPSIHICDEQDLIDELRRSLLHKRYFLVIDDLWDTSVWDVLRCAFPDNNNGSRVITTTRVERVAATCCTYRRECIYKMNPLNQEDSRRLFFNRIFGSEDDCPSELNAVSSEILRKCGGLPLAIITIASLLATQAGRVKEDWEHVRVSLGSNNFGTAPTLEDMRKILNLSYKNLSPLLKTCFLYLGAYPEDYIIWKDDLVRQWVAEGFVNKMHGQAVDVAVSCFNELVNRSMIQPVLIGYNDEVLSCRVHDMMLDLIIRRYSAKENFLTTVDNSGEIKGSIHNVRRLFDYSYIARHRTTPTITINLLKVRSLATYGTSIQMLQFQEYKFLRVLVLDFVDDSLAETTPVNLTAISKLFLLRYLKIHTDVQLKLPAQIGKLKYLEMLEIASRLKSSIAVPSDVVQLPCLSKLIILPYMEKLPDGIGTMRYLRSLAFFVLEENSLDNIRGLQHLTNLKELYIRCSGDSSVDTATHVDVLHSSLSELGDCKLYLTAWFRSPCFPGVPQWVGRLKNLYSLELGVRELSKDGISVLAGLPALVRLDLWIRGAPGERIVVSGEGFLLLKHLIITCRTLCLTFEAGAMPKLQKLKLEFNTTDGTEQGGNALVGVEHLSGLKEISASVGGFRDVVNESERKAAVSTLIDAIHLHPMRPRVDVTYVQGRYGF